MVLQSPAYEFSWIVANYIAVIAFCDGGLGNSLSSVTDTMQKYSRGWQNHVHRHSRNFAAIVNINISIDTPSLPHKTTSETGRTTRSLSSRHPTPPELLWGFGTCNSDCNSMSIEAYVGQGPSSWGSRNFKNVGVPKYWIHSLRPF